MHDIRTLTILALLGVFAVTSPAQTDAFETAKKSYEARSANFQQALDLEKATMDERFLEGLDLLMSRYRRDGKLDEMIAVRTARQAFQDRKTVTAAEVVQEPEVLKGAQEKYIKSLEKMENGLKRKLGKLTIAYLDHLEKLQTNFTRNDEIEKALAVKRAIEEIEPKLEDYKTAMRSRPQNAARPATVARGPQRSPGKLVVFGVYSDGEPVEIPEALRDKPFTKVAVGYDNWLALAPDGKVTGHVQNGFDIPDEKPAVDIVCGRHMHFILHGDGTISPVSNEHHLPTVPDLRNVTKIAAGHSLNVALLQDGTAVPFGYHLRDFAYPNPRKILTGVEDVACSANNFFLKKRDGSIVSSDLAGAEVSGRPEGLEDVIYMVSGISTHGAMFLTKEGKLIGWRSHETPSDLEIKAKEVRVSARNWAYRQENGIWKVHGAEPAATAMNQRLEELGPLKELSLGPQYFIGIK